MIFSIEEIRRLLEIVEYHNSFIIGNVLGNESLSDYDKFILNKNGIDPSKLKKGKETGYFESYLWGRLSTILSDKQANQVTYQDFEKYIKRGQYVPLNKQEQQRYDLAKQKTYGHIKGLGDKMKQTVNGIVVEQDQKKRSEYEKVIGDEIKRGQIDRKSVSSIVTEIGNKTNDWRRDWGRIVETETNDIFQQGRAEQIAEQDGLDSQAFKDVYDGACKNCIRVYLTGGIGSQPIIYPLNTLIANGNNYNKKQKDWKAVIGSTHPFCRCTLRKLPKGYVWDQEKGMFVLGKKEKKFERKSKVKITVGDKVFLA